MKISLKPLAEQVVVVTGATSGIGLTTAREADLNTALDAIRDDGGDAIAIVADVADETQVQAVADAAVEAYGGVDTWVNNAGVTIYGRIEDVTLDDARRLFETNYWGVVNGSRAAVPLLRAAGGALINVGSVLSDTAMPLQGHYSASKHAVKGFTDALRMELEKEGAPVSVTLVKPAAIDTPYPEHARNYLMAEPTHQPPVYAPEIVAEAILGAAERPRRDVRAGSASKMLASMQTLSPRLADRFKEATSFEGQHSDEAPYSEDTLYRPRAGDVRARGRYKGHVLRRSAFPTVSLHPIATVLGAVTVGLGVALLTRERY